MNNKEWQDPHFLHMGTDAPRSYFVPYADRKSALTMDKSKSEFYTLLNGVWDFAFFEKYYEMPRVIKKWDKIPVPSCWQMHGYEKPYYSNTNYPYPVDPPYVPDDNSCGVYRRFFEVNGKDRDTYIVFEGVSSCFYLYINGMEVGYNQGSHNQSEFNITDYLIDGKNEVMVKVLKWCDGSYLEKQGIFSFSGIFRDVYLLSRSKKKIRDIKLCTNLDTLKISVDCETSVTASLYEGKKKLFDKKFEKETEIIFKNAKIWTAETPNLYKLILKAEGEYIPQYVGFRTIEASDNGDIMVNGVSVTLKGVNRHDTHPVTGHVMTDADIKKDFKLMKRLNINCVKASYYPPTPEFFNMADRYGFYVIDEADIGMLSSEHRAKNKCVSHDSLFLTDHHDWNDAIWDRVDRMIERDKNHPSIIMWSSGIEPDYGKVYDIVKDKMQKKDTAPLVNYNGASTFCNWADQVIIEDGIPKYENDQSEYAYASDFDTDGLVFADRSFKADSLNAKYIYQYVKIDASNVNKGKFTVTNLYDFINLKDYKLKWEFVCDKEIVARGMMILDIAPKEKKEIEIKYDIPETCHLGCYVNFSCVSLNKTRLVPKDYEFAMAQFEADVPKIGIEVIPGKVLSTETENEIIINGNGFVYVFDKMFGNFKSMKVKHKELLLDKVRLTTWRAPADNDRRINSFLKTLDNNKNIGISNKIFNKVYSVECTADETIKIKVKGSLACVSQSPFSKFTTHFEIFPSGRVNIALDADIISECIYLSRFGFEFMLSDKMSKLEYFGMGPMENYVDMCTHAKVGYYTSRVKDEYVAYPKPQEHGNHTHTNYLSVCDRHQHTGLIFTSDDAFEFNASNYSSDQLTYATHTNDIGDKGKTIVRIDYKVSGISSNSCDSELSRKYQLNEKKIHYSFNIKPIL